MANEPWRSNTGVCSCGSLCVYVDTERDMAEEHRRRRQYSGAELAGFDMRMRIDDMLGKLACLRDLTDEPPHDLLAALDDADALLERAIDMVPTD